MEISIASQTVEFLMSAFLGLLLGGMYDIFRVARARIKIRFIPVFLDFCFWISVALAFFAFVMTVTSGTVRLYSVAGMTIGGLVYFLILSHFFLSVIFLAADLISKTLFFLSRPVVYAAEAVKEIFGVARKSFYLSSKRYTIGKRARKRVATSLQRGRPSDETAKRKSCRKNSGFGAGHSGRH